MKAAVMVALGWALTVTAPAWASVAVFPVDGTNLDRGEVAAIGQMMASSYQMESGEATLPPKQTAATLEAEGDYAPAASRLGASEYLFVSAVRLEERIVITASRYRADGTLLYSSKMTATSLDDLESISERLSRALHRQEAIRDTQSLGNVTRTEGRKPNRIWVEKVMGLKASYIYPMAYGGEDIAPMMSFGFDGRLEGESYFLEIGAGFLVPNGDNEDRLSYGGVYADLGGSVYLTNTSVSPYVGLGVLPRLVGIDITNFAAYAQVGAMFLRQSSSRIYVDLRASQNVMPVGFNQPYQYDATTGTTSGGDDLELYPLEWTLSVGMGW
jgi:hypothetical protein